jgi:hypothetical protein
MNHAHVTKQSGETEKFDRKKILNSLLNSGLEPTQAEDVLKLVIGSLKPPLHTKKIFKAVRKFMRQADPRSTMRYSLKKAMYALGPTGYPFERFISRVLDADGFDTLVGQIVPGRCVEHEVDVVARKDRTCYMVECKFHQTPSTLSNVKTALYVQARFIDIREAGIMCTSDESLDHKGMLVTNTRFSSQAIEYAECIGLDVLAWKYPQGRSLEQLIDRHRTYPVTVLPAVTRTNVGALLKNDIVLAREIDQMGEATFIHATGLPRNVASRIYRQACTACM